MARCFVTAALLMGLLTSGGCCWWCERHCPHSCAAYQVPAGAAPMCCPNTAYQPVYQPVAAQAPNFSQPHPANNPCYCPCPCAP
jgi:hypothetical protein